ncbi:uncharacterized protein [Nicotiana sylvestris]|uniref:uncharacterized protein n=1 Tax=Nicotiana sylvestris TaxID=4096 RepID=UPI00388C6175
MDPLKYIIQKPMPTGKLSKWQILLSELYIVNVTQKAIKGQTLADHLPENPVDREYEPLKTYFPDEEVEEKADEKPWFHDIKEYLAKGEYPELANPTQKRTLWRLSNNFFHSGGILYRRTSDLGLLRCVDVKEASKLSEEIHVGTCGPHMNDFVLAKKILRAATSYRVVTKKVVVDFVRDRIVCRFGIPESIITDNGSNLNSDLMKAICDSFRIIHKNSIAYRPQMNGAVEATNKNIKKILRKMVEKHKQ